MHQILVVQGGGADVHDQWDHQLVASLEAALGPTYEIRYPRMPDEADPHFVAWQSALQHELASLRDRAILVGHSIGGTILLHALAACAPPHPVQALVLIAPPFVGNGGWPSDEMTSPADWGDTPLQGIPVYLFHGLADETAPPAHADLYAQALPWAQVTRLPGRDHQLNNDLTEIAQLIRSLTTPWVAGARRGMAVNRALPLTTASRRLLDALAGRNQSHAAPAECGIRLLPNILVNAR